VMIMVAGALWLPAEQKLRQAGAVGTGVLVYLGITIMSAGLLAFFCNRQMRGWS
jgi:hypothetical protein